MPVCIEKDTVFMFLRNMLRRFVTITYLRLLQYKKT